MAGISRVAVVLGTSVYSHIQVSKIPLSFSIGISAAIGYLLQKPFLSPSLLGCIIGTFLLAAGSAVWNNLQDRNFDRYFSRTCHRPLVTSKIDGKTAFIQGGLLVLTGFWILVLFSPDFRAAFAGLLAVGLYNGLYTGLKQKTLFALIPGASCGMMPPYIGWVAAGGETVSLKIILFMVLIGIWQIPHFNLSVLDHRREYLASRQFNSLASVFSVEQLRRITLIWVASFCLLMLSLPLAGLAVVFDHSRVLLIINAGFLMITFLKHLTGKPRARYRLLFVCLNLSLAAVMLTIAADLLI